MEPVRVKAVARARAEREAAARKRTISIRVGVLGLVLVFGGAVGVIVSTADALLLIAPMATGIVLLIAAFLLVRTSAADLLQTLPDH